MNLLIDAEQPGNHLDDYVSRLNSILSQKAAGILKLQSQLANFKRRLNEHNVLVSAARYWFYWHTFCEKSVRRMIDIILIWSLLDRAGLIVFLIGILAALAFTAM